MTTQPITNPREAESRAAHQASADARTRFAEHVAAASAPRPAAPVQPNVDLLAEAQRLQAEVDPKTGQRRYVTDTAFREQVEATRRRAFETGPGSAVDRNRHDTGAPIAAPPGMRWEANPDAGKPGVSWQRRLVPDESHVPSKSEPDAFGSQSAERDRVLGDRTAQHDALNALAATRVNGERLYDKPAERARVEEMRAKLFAGEDISQWLTEAKSVVAEANFTPVVKASGYVIRAPEIEGYDVQLDSALVAQYAKTAREAGLTQEQFQKLVDQHVRSGA